MGDIRDQFYVFGEIRSIRMVPKQCCAFVTFVSREVAEEAASKLYRLLQIKGKKVNVMWGRPQQTQQSQSSAEMAGVASSSAATGMAPANAGNVYRPYYPSMDPAASGNAVLEGEIADERGGQVVAS